MVTEEFSDASLAEKALESWSQCAMLITMTLEAVMMKTN